MGLPSASFECVVARRVTSRRSSRPGQPGHLLDVRFQRGVHIHWANRAEKAWGHRLVRTTAQGVSDSSAAELRHDDVRVFGRMMTRVGVLPDPGGIQQPVRAWRVHGLTPETMTSHRRRGSSGSSRLSASGDRGQEAQGLPRPVPRRPTSRCARRIGSAVVDEHLEIWP